MSRINHLRARVVHLLRRIFRIKQTVVLNGLKLRLPYDHLLPKYLKKYPSYDRFLPILGSLLPNNSLVIDVGANVGDTTLSMYSLNSQLKFLCVEPSRDFYNFLNLNLSQLSPSIVHTVNQAISNQTIKYELTAKGGTAQLHNHKSQGIEHTVSLDDVVRGLPSHLNDSRVSLLKSDTDGYDAKVILSASELIYSQKPVIFMECQVENEEDIVNYKEAFTLLSRAGYSEWFLFSNTGIFIEKVENWRLLDRVMKQNLDYSITTGFTRYFDLLVSTKTDLEIVSSAISRHEELKFA